MKEWCMSQKMHSLKWINVSSKKTTAMVEDQYSIVNIKTQGSSLKILILLKIQQDKVE